MEHRVPLDNIPKFPSTDVSPLNREEHTRDRRTKSRPAQNCSAPSAELTGTRSQPRYAESDSPPLPPPSRNLEIDLKHRYLFRRFV